jgi:hypothetical protein
MNVYLSKVRRNLIVSERSPTNRTGKLPSRWSPQIIFIISTSRCSPVRPANGSSSGGPSGAFGAFGVLLLPHLKFKPVPNTGSDSVLLALEAGHDGKICAKGVVGAVENPVGAGCAEWDVP